MGSGMLAALTHLGMRDVFDVIYGSSAGRQLVQTDMRSRGRRCQTHGRQDCPVCSFMCSCVCWVLAGTGSLMGAYFLTDQTPYEGPGVSSSRQADRLIRQADRTRKSLVSLGRMRPFTANAAVAGWLLTVG